MMSHLLPGLRMAVRSLSRTPGATTLAVGTMAVAIGTTTAIFSVVYGTVFKPLPYPEPDRLVSITSEFPKLKLVNMGLSGPELVELRTLTQSWSALGAVSFGVGTLGGPEPRRIVIARASADSMAALAVLPAIGRLFDASDDRAGAGRVALLGHGLWLRAFGGNTDVVGRSIDLDGERYDVLGVMPPGFDLLGSDTGLWVPLAFDPKAPGPRADHNLRVIARLNPGVPLSRARTDLDAAVSRWLVTTGELHSPAPRFHPLAVTPLHDAVVGELRPTMTALLGAVGFVLLLACANVSNVLLARGEARRHQLAVRLALGASKGRLLFEHLLEGSCLAAAGCAAGISMAYLLSGLIVSTAGALPRRNELDLDVASLLFAVGITAVCAVVFGVIPVIRLNVAQLQHSLQSEGRSQTGSRDRRRLQHTLIAWQVAAAVTLLAGAGVLVRSFWRLVHVDPGVRTENVLTFQVSLPARAYAADGRVWSFYEELVERASQLPGVKRVAAMSGRLPERRANNTTFLLEGVPVQGHEGMPQVDYIQHVTPGYFETLGIRLIAGRFFTASDSERSEPIVVVNETLARKFWPDVDPIGRRLRAALPDGPWFRVVGVVSDVKHGGLAAPIGTELYVAHRQARVLLPGWLPTGMHVVALVDAGQLEFLRTALPAVARAIEPHAAVANLRALEDALSQSVAGPRFLAGALGAFAGLSLLLASIGIYGVVACAVTQRTSEFAVRVALGATPRAILRLVVSQASVPIVAGAVLGLVGAIASRNLLGTLVFQTPPVDPASLVVVLVLLLVIAMLACCVPARRATRVDPITALKNV